MTAARRLAAVPPTPARQLNVLDLTAGQIEQVELDIGVPASRWNRAPSEAALYTAVLAAVEGVPRSELSSLTLRELKARIDLTADADPDP